MVRQHLLSGWPRFGSLLQSSRAMHSYYSGQDVRHSRNGFEFTPFSFVLRILWIITFIQLTSAGSQLESSQQSTLLFVFTLSRHGDRTPLHQPLDDSYGSLWSNGKGQLTRLGVQQHVELGRYIRQQYAALLPAQYHKNSFFFRSTGTSRTIQSGTSFIRGLFNRTDDRQNPDSLTVDPPLFSMPVREDRLLKMSSFCPRAKQMVNELFNGPESRTKVQQYEHTISVLERFYPQLFSPDRQLPSKLLLGSWKACDSVTILVNHNAPHRPSWLTPEIYADCVHLLDWKQYIRFSRAALTRLHGGPLLAHILRLLRTRANAQLLATGRKVSRSELPAPHGHEMLSNATVNHSLVSYFAHDSTLAAVLSHLGIFDSRKPPLASTLIFELHEINWRFTQGSHGTHESDPFYVRVIYRNYSWPDSERADNTTVLRPAGCVAKPVTPNQYSPGHTNWCWLDQLESAIRDTYAKSEPDECIQSAGWFHLWDKPVTPNSFSLLQFIGLLFSQVVFFRFL